MVGRRGESSPASRKRRSFVLFHDLRATQRSPNKEIPPGTVGRPLGPLKFAPVGRKSLVNLKSQCAFTVIIKDPTLALKCVESSSPNRGCHRHFYKQLCAFSVSRPPNEADAFRQKWDCLLKACLLNVCKTNKNRVSLRSPSSHSLVMFYLNETECSGTAIQQFSKKKLHLLAKSAPA